MKKLVVISLLLVFAFPSNAQDTAYEKDINAILKILKAQEDAWNNYDIETFMEGYWKSDELTFYGSGGVIKGWQATLERYRKSYPSKEHFGTLKFKFNEIAPIAEESYYIMGEYHLTRSMGDTNGIFMLVLKQINGEWKVIADTSAKIN